MSRQYNIKWREQDEKELRRVARNFNDKLRREIKKSSENKNILPQFYNEDAEQFESRVTVKMLHESIKTRADYNRLLNMLKRFSKRGAERVVEIPINEYGSKTTVWQKQESARLASIVNKKRQERLDMLNNVEMLNAQGKLGYTLGERFGMGLASRNKLKPTKSFTKAQSQADIKEKLRALMKESGTTYFSDRDELLKENYIRTLAENYKATDIADVVAKIKDMNPDAFILKFEAKGDAFEFAYPPDEEQYQNYLEELKAYWKNDNILDYSPALTTTLLNQ